MTPNEYLKQILKQEILDNDSDEIKAIWEEREKVEKLIRDGFPDSSPTIRYGGGKAKGTMVRCNFDLDIICYFPNDDSGAGDNLEEIYNNVRKVLEAEYMVEGKNAALRLLAKSGANKGIYFHIDVVPGRFTDDKCEDAFLYQKDADKCRLKTNLQQHIDKIRNSGLQDHIRLAKIWKKKSGQQIRTFVLELLVVEILGKSEKSNLEICMTSFWESLRDNIDSLSIEDPANPNGNDLSPYFDENIKALLQNCASIALTNVACDNWSFILGPAETVTNSEKAFAVGSYRMSNPGAPEPFAG